MKANLLTMASLILLFLSLYGAAQTLDKPHTPKKGSVERERILDALRDGQTVKFKVHYLEVQKGWAWIDATPLGADGKAVAEGGASLLKLNDDGAWKIVDLSNVPEDPDNPMGADDLSAKYIVNLRKTFPEMPPGILPKLSR